MFSSGLRKGMHRFILGPRPDPNYIQEGTHQRLLAIDGVNDAEVDVVWSPGWEPAMMFDEAKRYFGFA